MSFWKWYAKTILKYFPLFLLFNLFKSKDIILFLSATSISTSITLSFALRSAWFLFILPIGITGIFYYWWLDFIKPTKEK